MIEPPTQLTPWLWVGGAIDPDNEVSLRDRGITHILNVCRTPDATGLHTWFSCAWAPTDDDFVAKPSTWFQRGVSIARQVRSRSDGALYVHCAQGVHRGPLMAYAMLRVIEGLTTSDARRRIAKRRAAELPEIYLQSAETFVATIEDTNRPDAIG